MSLGLGGFFKVTWMNGWGSHHISPNVTLPNVKTNIPRTTSFFRIRRETVEKVEKDKRSKEVHWNPRKTNWIGKRSQFTILTNHYRVIMLMRSPLLFGGCWLHTCVHPWYLKDNSMTILHKTCGSSDILSPSFPISAGLWQETSDPMMPRNKPKWGICSPWILGTRGWHSLQGKGRSDTTKRKNVKRSWWQCAKS